MQLAVSKHSMHYNTILHSYQCDYHDANQTVSLEADHSMNFTGGVSCSTLVFKQLSDSHFQKDA